MNDGSIATVSEEQNGSTKDHVLHTLLHVVGVLIAFGFVSIGVSQALAITIG